MMNEFIFSGIRVTVLSDDIIRVEKAKKTGFYDERSYFIPDRDKFGGAQAVAAESERSYTVAVGDLVLTVPKTGKMKGVSLACGGETWRYKNSVNTGELPQPHKTPFVFVVADNPRITIPDEGYRSGSKYTVEENVEDVYLLVCRHDCKKLRALYTALTGSCELVRLSTLGLWNSRYYKHDDKSARALLDEYFSRGVPLDNMVLDTDWRKASDRGIGYEVDDKLFPDMTAFFDYAHSRGVEVIFNDHPEPVEGTQSVFDEREMSYRESNLKAHLNSGLDCWWYDRNWHTKLKSPSAAVAPESLGLYLFYDVTRQVFEDKTGEYPRRAVVMGNVDNIHNGRYVAIGDSASHRYSIQWTGDVGSDGAALAGEIRNLVRAQNSGIAYVNSDCGGHTGNPTAHEYLRWMQFGAFSPILRPHCTNSVLRFREPWVYDEATFGAVVEYIKMRYRLLPVIYKNAYRNYVDGTPIFKPLGYEYPTDKTAARIDDEYMLGDCILVAPLHGVEPKKLTEKDYYTDVFATYYGGVECEGKPLWRTVYTTLDLYWNNEQPAPEVPKYNFSAEFETTLCFKRDCELIVESDDGVTVFVDGVKTLEDKTYHGALKQSAGILSGGKPHRIEIKYFQGMGEAAISLYRNDLTNKCSLDTRWVYLPAGEWVDPFTGNIHAGEQKIFAKCDMREMPLFVRRGGVIPVIECAQTTKEQDRDSVTYDYYPGKAEYSDYLYEDDGETTAYKHGVYRISPFSARYDGGKKAYALTLGKSSGGYKTGVKRNVTVKLHLLSDMSGIAEVRVDGKSVEFEVAARDKQKLPFSIGAACDTDTVSVSFEHDVTRDATVEFIEK